MIAMRTQTANYSIAVKSIRDQPGNRDRKERLTAFMKFSLAHSDDSAAAQMPVCDRWGLGRGKDENGCGKAGREEWESKRLRLRCIGCGF